MGIFITLSLIHENYGKCSADNSASTVISNNVSVLHCPHPNATMDPNDWRFRAKLTMTVTFSRDEQQKSEGRCPVILRIRPPTPPLGLSVETTHPSCQKGRYY